MKIPTLLILALVLLSGCSSKVVQISKQEPSLIPTHEMDLICETLTYNDNDTTISSKNSVLLALYNEYKKWNHTPYKYGGISKYGVDCSSLVQQVYFNALRVPVPRTTALQAKIGYRVPKHQSQTGDLLLFKTAHNTRHSGIYLESGDFINASSKRGVTISNLNNPYWKSKYWQTRRILP